MNFPKLADWLCMGWSVCQAAAKAGNSNRGRLFLHQPVLYSVRNCNRRHRPLRWISILSRFRNVRLQHPHYVLCLLFQSDVDIACADHARKKRGRTIARLRHAAISLLPSVISRRRRRRLQRIKACKGIRSSLTRMPICGAWCVSPLSRPIASRFFL